MQRLTLPFPPSVNHYWKHSGHRVYLSKDAVSYRQSVQNALHCTKPLDARLSVSVLLHAPNKRKYDIDNRVKSLLDSLTHAGVWVDDGLIDKLTIERGNIISGGLCVVEIKELQQKG